MANKVKSSDVFREARVDNGGKVCPRHIAELLHFTSKAIKPWFGNTQMHGCIRRYAKIQQ